VVSLTGDGGFNMMLGELETARRLKASPTIVVLNNAASGYVKALQHFIYGENRYYASDLSETNYANVANAFGCKGIRIEHPGQLKNALRDAIASQTLTVLDVVITRDPARMLPGVDSRTVSVTPGDRIA
jgi:acetolactate synthase-1/2/3 large subunit